MDKAVKVFEIIFINTALALLELLSFFLSLSTTLIQINLFRVENTCFAKRCQKQIIRNRLKYLFTDLNSIFNSKKWRMCRAQRQYLSTYRIQRYLDEMERKWRKVFHETTTASTKISVSFEYNYYCIIIDRYIIGRATNFLLHSIFPIFKYF